jgi:hypothetical protein
VLLHRASGPGSAAEGLGVFPGDSSRSTRWKTKKRGECGQGQNRTADTRIFSPLLYRLSYLAIGGKVEILPKSSGESSFLASRNTFDLSLDEVYYIAFQANVIKPVDLLNPRRAGNVDFGEKTANDIQADKIESVGTEQRR